MVNQYPGEGLFKAWEPPFEQYAYPLRVLKRVARSIVGASGITRDSERQQVLAMARQIPNITGVFMDDFVHHGQGDGGSKPASLAPNSRKLPGCYTADLVENQTPRWRPMPVATTQHQCEVSLRSLREGTIEGIIIYGTAMDLNWGSGEWARAWIQ